MRLIDVDEMMDDINRSIEALTKVGIVCDGDFLWGKLNDAIYNASTITTKEVKYFDEEEKVWKIGRVIVDE